MKQTAVELIIEEINKQQRSYILLAKGNKSLKKGVEVILTATTLLKIKCEKLKEMEKQQIINARVNGVAEGIDIGGNPITEDISKNHEIYYNETFNK